MPRPAAIFDLDGTLLRGPSAEKLLLRRALRAGALPPLRAALGLMKAVAAWMAGRVVTPGECKAYLEGVECRRVEALAVDCVHTDLASRLRPALLREVERHREQGHRLVLLTGTPDFLAAELARFLHLDMAVGSRLERAGGRFTGRVLPPYPFGEGKRQALLEMASRDDIDLAVSHAYANRSSDAAHLGVVGHAFAVAPDRGLRSLARRRGWSVLEDVDAAQGSAPDRSSR